MKFVFVSINYGDNYYSIVIIMWLTVFFSLFLASLWVLHLRAWTRVSTLLVCQGGESSVNLYPLCAKDNVNTFMQYQVQYMQSGRRICPGD